MGVRKVVRKFLNVCFCLFLGGDAERERCGGGVFLSFIGSHVMSCSFVVDRKAGLHTVCTMRSNGTGLDGNIYVCISGLSGFFF